VASARPARYPSAAFSTIEDSPVAVPKRKTSKQRRDKRRATHAIQATRLGRCARCQSPIRPHRVCAVCGTYRGREVIETEI
jgi:large subunit ribosomal protein L32